MLSPSPGDAALEESGSVPPPDASNSNRSKQRARRAAEAKAAEFLERYRFNPTLFGEEVLNVKFDPWQIEANAAIADYVKWQFRRDKDMLIQKPGEVKNWFTVRAMHGPGKTFWCGSLILWFGSVFVGARIPCIAPKLDQLKTRLWLEMKTIRARATPDFQKLTEDIGSIHLRWANDDTWTAFGQTATHAENLSGLHNDYLMVVIDEATGVNENLFPTIMGALSTGKIIILVMISNPSKNTGTFAHSWLKPLVAKSFHHIGITLDKAPRVSRTWVEAMEAKYGKGSPIVKIRCYGEFADDSPSQLISTAWILAAFDREAPDISQESTKLRVSGDVADGGEDETVITAGREHSLGRTLLKVTRHSFPSSKAPIMTAEEMIKRFVEYGGRKGVDEMVVDGLGVGAGTAGYLMQKGHRVVVHKGGEASSDPARWRNRRVQNYIAARDAYRDGRVFFDDECFADELDKDEACAQLASVNMNHSTDKVDDLETREQMKTRGVKSPDIADSITMQYTSAQGEGQGIMDHTRLEAERVARDRGAAAQRVVPATQTATESAGVTNTAKAPSPVVTTTHGEITDAYRRRA